MEVDVDDSTSSELNSGRSSMSDELIMPPSINLRFKRAHGCWEIIGRATMGRIDGVVVDDNRGQEQERETDGVTNAYPNCKSKIRLWTRIMSRLLFIILCRRSKLMKS